MNYVIKAQLINIKSQSILIVVCQLPIQLLESQNSSLRNSQINTWDLIYVVQQIV